MTQPLFFDPDPEYPDADLLGYGDLIYPDGRREYLNGDPELAGMLQLYQPPGDMGPAAPPLLEPGQYSPEELAGPPPTLQGADGTEYEVTPEGLSPITRGLNALGNALAGAPGADSSSGIGTMLGDAATGFGNMMGGGSVSPEQAPPEPAAQAPLLETGRYTPEQLAGPPPTVQGADGTQYQITPQGMVPVQREGALPPDLAAEQLGALGAQQQATLAATEQARMDEVRLVRELTLRQMAANEAEKVRREQEIAENQMRVERWQSEQQQLADMEIETDLVAARGPLGAAMAVLGATLLGAVGNDAGLRMIDKAIDTSVREQVRRRDTKLGILAEQIQNTNQAIAMGKAKLYEVAANRLEILATKTKNDIYEAQTPAVIEGLRQKQLEYYQESQRTSLGKTLEKVAAPKPPSPELLQKYGEMRRDRDASSQIAQRVEQQVGLRWSPGKNGQPGFYVNRDEVVKGGIQGIGNLEQWLPDAVYSTMGGYTAEGRQVRGAAEAMAYAQIRQMQPTGPISNADIQAAVKAGALETEEGMLRGLERIRVSAEQAEAHDAAQFGPDVVAEYNRRYQQSGGQTMTKTPAASHKTTVQEARGALDQRPPEQQPGAALAREMSPDQRMAQVAEDLMAMAGELALPPRAIDILIAQAAHESGMGNSEGAAQANMFGHKATRGRRSFEAMTTEGEGTEAKRMKQTFAAYDTIADSVADHLSLLQRRYPRAWEALQNEDESAYVAALKDGGYFTGNEGIYLRRIQERL